MADSLYRLFCLRSMYCVSNGQTICLYSGQMNREGGSTPGKAIFGISVVSCHTIIDLGDGLIRVIPAKNIGILRYIAFHQTINYLIFYDIYNDISLLFAIIFQLLGHYCALLSRTCRPSSSSRPRWLYSCPHTIGRPMILSASVLSSNRSKIAYNNWLP